MIISASINLSKIDKTKIIEGKNGAKYYNISVFVKDEKDKYDNDVAVATSQSKEERASKEKTNFIGNGRVVYFGKFAKTNNEENNSNQSTDDLPF
jgi:hypothetical protein